MADEKYARRFKRSAVFYTPIAVLLIILLLIFGISVFFRVSSVEVTGAKKYTEQQVVAASGIKTGDNLVFIDSYAIASKIMTNLPYLNDVQIDKLVPDKIEIRVTESQPIAVVSMNGVWWLLDQKGRVLDKTNADTAAKKIQITGISPTSIAISNKLTVAANEQTKLTYLTNVLSALSGAGMADDVKSVDMSNIGSISFVYQNRLTVVLGTGENIDYKMSLLKQVLNQVKPQDKGKVDLSRDNKYFWIPNQ